MAKNRKRKTHYQYPGLDTGFIDMAVHMSFIRWLSATFSFQEFYNKSR